MYLMGGRESAGVPGGRRSQESCLPRTSTCCPEAEERTAGLGRSWVQALEPAEEGREHSTHPAGAGVADLRKYQQMYTF